MSDERDVRERLGEDVGWHLVCHEVLDRQYAAMIEVTHISHPALEVLRLS